MSRSTILLLVLGAVVAASAATRSVDDVGMRVKAEGSAGVDPIQIKGGGTRLLTVAGSRRP